MSPDSLAKEIGERLIVSNRTLAAAESCTGGLISHHITNIPGASDYFLGGVVAYSNDAKKTLLGVSEASLASSGAVSEPVALEMVLGAQSRFAADVAVAVTGIAGPDGATPEKPVGLVYIAVASGGKTSVSRHVFSGSRSEVKRQTAEKALVLVLERVS